MGIVIGLAVALVGGLIYLVTQTDDGGPVAITIVVMFGLLIFFAWIANESEKWKAKREAHKLANPSGPKPSFLGAGKPKFLGLDQAFKHSAKRMNELNKV
jgi:hypothetical protein